MKPTPTKSGATRMADPLYGCQLHYERRPYGSRRHRTTYTWASIEATNPPDRWGLGDPYPALHWPHDLLAYEIAAQLCVRGCCPTCGQRLECRMAVDESDWVIGCIDNGCPRSQRESPAIPVHPQRRPCDCYRTVFPDVQAWLREDAVAGVVYVDKLLVPLDRRGRGQGRAWLQTLCDATRSHGRVVVLTPTKVLQSVAAAPLRDWFSRMGFLNSSDPDLPGVLIKSP